MNQSCMIVPKLNSTKEAVVAIPARIGSTRLPRKVLLEINGKPMLHHVVERCLEVESVAEVFVVTDSEEVFESLEKTNANALMSAPECPSGTARIASVIDQLPGDIIINVQADQPIVEPELISDIIRKFRKTNADIATPVWKITKIEDLEDPSLAKVVRSHDNRALYFSRSPIPYVRDQKRINWTKYATCWAHYGVYAYRRIVLENLKNIPLGDLEMQEKLEQLRFLEAGFWIHTIETSYRQCAVDSKQDLEKLEKKLLL